MQAQIRRLSTATRDDTAPAIAAPVAALLKMIFKKSPLAEPVETARLGEAVVAFYALRRGFLKTESSRYHKKPRAAAASAASSTRTRPWTGCLDAWLPGRVVDGVGGRASSAAFFVRFF